MRAMKKKSICLCDVQKVRLEFCNRYIQIGMLPSIKKTLIPKSNLSKDQFRRLLSSRFFNKKSQWIDQFLVSISGKDSVQIMSSYKFRVILKDLSFARLWTVWSRSTLINTVIKRCKKDRSVREVFHSFRQTFLRPRRYFLISATAACKSRDEDDTKSPCSKSISDEDMESLVRELETVEELSKKTLYCEGCNKRVIIDKKHVGVVYCRCKDSHPPESSLDGWMPYMEADDVIFWRKEYKPGKGLYAYKVYGRYKELHAKDFAAVQVDGGYRRAWDSAVAALSVVERDANGYIDQAVLHWEVLWPRLFANRDYVYIRRHKEFDIETTCLQHKDGIFSENQEIKPCIEEDSSTNVHSRAKRKSLESYQMESSKRGDSKDNKVYVIISRSCAHPKVPETNKAIRVTEYWSHMVIQTLDGPDQPGMEFVLTYYDEPAVGGMPSGVSSWATGRAAPAFLGSMRNATAKYKRWREMNKQEAPDFTPFGPEKVSFEPQIREEDMETSKEGPDMDSKEPDEQNEPKTNEQGTQTDAPSNMEERPTTRKDLLVKFDKSIDTKDDIGTKNQASSTPDQDGDKPSEDVESGGNGGWFRYIYPFYYFI